MSASVTTITWPPVKETHIITTFVNGSIISIPAYQTANETMFTNATLSASTTTKPPPTTVFGAQPPPPYVSGSPTSTSSNKGNGPSNAIVWRNLGLVILAVVILAVMGGFMLKRHRSGQAKKQEPRNFTQVGEDDGESERGGRTGDGDSSNIPGGSSISLATLGPAAGTSSIVRERRNSQPIPRALDLGGNLRS